RELKRTITDKTPDQLKMPWALWTRRSIQEFIRRRWGLTMPVRTIGDYLKRWGFTPQKPLRRAYEQNPKAVEKWLHEEYPAIRARAKRENAEIHWGDETGIRSDSQHGRSYAPRGQTPEIRITVNRVSLNLISTITNQGKVRFMTYTGTMNSQTLIRFLRRLIKDADRKVFLILDNLRVHHSKPVKAWLAAHQEEIEVFYLPSYSP
ncbi:IS630 family transposase, partial [Deferrisoma palaeochoriense]